MSNYRRANAPGTYYFFTVVTYDRRTFLTDDPARECLRRAWRIVRRRRPWSHSSGGSRKTSSAPSPQDTVVMASQPSKGVPSSVSPVRQASVSPITIPVSSVR